MTVQREVLGLLHEVREETGAAILLISHDMAVITGMCTRVLVMFAGEIVEDIAVDDLIAGRAKHPYTRALIAAVPTMSTDRDKPLATVDEAWQVESLDAEESTADIELEELLAVAEEIPMSRLEFRDVNVHLGSGSKKFHAVKNINLDIPSGSVVGLVGESGSGKSTLARATVGLAEPSSGQILLDGVDVAHARGATARLRHRIQMVFQDPYSCLDPRMTIGQSLAEALRSTERRDKARRSRGDRAAEVARLLTTVQLPVEKAHEYPSSLSGGQRQRVALARALAAAPAVLLADEITSALDVSVQGAVLNLLVDLQKQLGLTVLFVSHNLAVIRYVCDHVAVMLGGEIVEHGPVLDVIDSPKEPYTAKLLSAIPTFGEPMFQ